MSQTIYGWRYPDGEIDSSYIDYSEWAVWRKRWKHSGQYENAGSALYPMAYKDFEHWVEVMKKEGHSIVCVRIVEVR